jgi:hypothetical protein
MMNSEVFEKGWLHVILSHFPRIYLIAVLKNINKNQSEEHIFGMKDRTQDLPIMKQEC